MPCISVRLDDAQVAEIDDLTTLLTERAQGVRISRAEALRAIVAKGIAAIRAEIQQPRTK
jgi:hypothetical protein